MRRTLSAVGLIGAAIMLLSGCVGIPSTGGVVAGDLIGDQGEADIIVLPAGPRAGATQEDLLAAFMLALRGPQSDYATARLFLTKAMDATWDPDASVIIRSGIPATTPGPEVDTLNYTVTARASVDADGRYTEQPSAQQTFEFAFAQVDGEWRISDAPDVVVLSQQSFGQVFTERSLYYFDPSHQFLVPDVRWFPSRPTVTTRVINALLAGPAEWLLGGVVQSAFPTATTLDKVSIESGTATVQLSKEALTASPADRDFMRQQLEGTLGIANVAITVGGLALISPAPGTVAVINPPVEGPVLVGTSTDFGFVNGDGVQPIDVSAQIVAAGATAVTISADKRSAAILSTEGVSVALPTTSAVTLIDNRPGLISPALDPFRFVWSVQGASAASLTTFEVDGTPHAVQTGLAADAGIVSVDVSRDGTRVLLYLSTSVGPKLQVAGIIRDTDNTPIRLGTPEDLPVLNDTPIDATWVSDRVVAGVARGAEGDTVTAYELGGPTAAIGQVSDSLAIVGGNGGADGLRVLSADGEVWRPQGSGWVSTGVTASFIATKQ